MYQKIPLSFVFNAARPSDKWSLTDTSHLGMDLSYALTVGPAVVDGAWILAEANAGEFVETYLFLEEHDG